MDDRAPSELRKELKQLLQKQIESLKQQSFQGLNRREVSEQEDRVKRIRELFADYFAESGVNQNTSTAALVALVVRPEPSRPEHGRPSVPFPRRDRTRGVEFRAQPPALLDGRQK
jgi:hypothetical protein